MLNPRLQLALTVLCAVALILFWITGTIGFGIASVVFGSVFALQTAWGSLREKAIDVNVLMVLAAAGAVWLGHYGEAAVLLFLFSLSNTLEGFTLGKTKKAIEALIKLRPDQATRVVDGQDEKVALEDIQVGDLIRVAPYDQIPLDGLIETNQSHIDASSMTGESVPISVGPGDGVVGGTQNLEGMILMRVSSTSGNSTLDRIIRLVQEAQENESSGEKISSWFGQRYTFFVIGAFLLSLIIRILIGQKWDEAIHASLTLLVALSPCALVISTPATTLSALAWSARNGVLCRGGESIELAGQVDTLVVDKTGTLTAGRPELVEICACSHLPSEDTVCEDAESCWHGEEHWTDSAVEILRLAAGAEQYSQHPLAQAIVRAAEKKGLVVPIATHTEVVPGHGVKATIEDREVKIGQAKFFPQLPKGFEFHADELRQKGLTVALLQVGNHYAALGMRDQIRPQSIEAIKSVRTQGIREIHLFTGDNKETAAVIAKQAGVDEFIAQMSPEDKERNVAEFSERGKKVMMVGDGVNDAPALARAHVGVAMGGLGSDVALEASDIVLMDDRLEKIPQIIALGRKTGAIIKVNLIFSTGVMAVLSIGSIVVDAIAPQYRNLLLPFAVVGHEGSTVLVILNGLRMLNGPGKS